MKPCTDTIVALATPPGRGGVAMVRISGPLVPHIAVKLFQKILTPRYATFARVRDISDQVIDEGIALFFPHPHSFTGEDVLEFHGHGGPVLVNCVIQRILELGARIARPGEFSERAFLNNKMDLTQAEAIADIIQADSEQAARSAMRSLQGEFSKRIHKLVEKIIQLRMYVEAAIDFAEEEIDFLSNQQVSVDLTTILQDLTQIEATAAQGSLMRDGISVVIIGQPNVGKSTLLNQLSGKDIAIVTNIPGTTRDILREQMVIDGMPLHIIDTAGIRESQDIVEQEGIRRAQNEMTRADLILWMQDAHSSSHPLPPHFPTHIKTLTIRNKIDLTAELPSVIQKENEIIITLSAKTGWGIELLKDQIKLAVGYQTQAEGIFSARRRHLDALTRAKKFLLMGQAQLEHHRAGELLAEELRLAQQALNEITGEFTSDDLLGRIFASFCIGK